MAQPFAPRAGYVYPAGGQQGSSFDITVGGQYMDGVDKAFISGKGLKIAYVEHVKPINQKEFNDLREKLAELQKKRPFDDATAKEVAEIRKKITAFLTRSLTPAIAETVTFRVTIEKDAPPGARDLRIQTPMGLSNPVAFRVGQLPETSKAPGKVIENPQEARAARTGEPPKDRSNTPAMKIALPTVANGQILPGSVDRYKFAATKGQKLVIAAAARELIPYIADAVPGWFQATMTLYDADGHELEYADHFSFHQDPVLCFEVPKDGDYVLEVHDSLYRGREDFVYRITVGEVPYITGIFPLGCKAGSQATVELMGWNLPTDKLMEDAKDRGAGVLSLSVSKKDWVSNSVPFAVDTLPEVFEKKPNSTSETAQKVTLPVIVNGRVEKAGQWSVFPFDGRAGDEIVAEVIARRLGSPLDSVLKLTDANGKQLAFNDDLEDKGHGLDTHHADSYIRVKLPESGTYYLYLGDAQRQAGPQCAYRLRLSAPRPDYELRVAPSGIDVRGGGSVPITVYALRQDGFSGEIELSLKDAPAGFSLSGARIPASADQARLTLTAPTAATKEPVALALEGKAKIQGRDVVKRAVPAEDMMQAFAYRHLVPAQELVAAVSDKWSAFRAIQVLSKMPVKIPSGKTATIQVSVPPGIAMANFKLELNDPPEGISIQNESATRDGAEFTIIADAAKAKPGLKGNLIVNISAGPRNPGGGAAPKKPAIGTTSAPATSPTTAPATSTTTTPAKPPAKGQGNQRRLSLGTLPAIPFEVVEP